MICPMMLSKVGNAGWTTKVDTIWQASYPSFLRPPNLIGD